MHAWHAYLGGAGLGAFAVAAAVFVAALLGRVRVDRFRLRGVVRRARRLAVIRVVIRVVTIDKSEAMLQEQLERTLCTVAVALELDHDLALALAAPHASVPRRVELAAVDALVGHPAIQLKE